MEQLKQAVDEQVSLQTVRLIRGHGLRVMLGEQAVEAVQVLIGEAESKEIPGDFG